MRVPGFFPETKMNSSSRYVVLQILVLLSVETLRANSDSCSISRATVQTVIDCPVTEEGWRKAAERKNCSAYADQCSQPEKLVYHCVINPFVNQTIEVCTYRKIIVFGHCTEYSYSANIIQESRSTDCTKFTDRPCPQGYPSTEAYKYPGCYDLTKASSTENPTTLQTSDSPMSTQDVQNIMTSEESAQDEGVTGLIIVVTVVFVVLAVIGILTVLKIRFVYKRKITRTVKGQEENEENEERSFHYHTILAEEGTRDERIHLAPSGKHAELQGICKQIQVAVDVDETPDIAINPEKENVEDDCRRLTNILSDGLERLTIVQSEHHNGDDGDDHHKKRTAMTAEKIYSSKFSNESSKEIRKYISELESLEDYFKRPKKKEDVFMPP